MSSANSFYQERLKDKFLEKAMKDATSDGTSGHNNGTSDPMNPLMLEAEMFAIKVSIHALECALEYTSIC
mgnify:CR=1 FL=1